MLVAKLLSQIFKFKDDGIILIDHSTKIYLWQN